MDVNFPNFPLQIFYAGFTGVGNVIVMIKKMTFQSNMECTCVDNVHVLYTTNDIGDIK